MTVFDLLSGAGFSCDGVRDTEVTLVTDDSRKAAAGSVFVCIKGAHFDGHDAAVECERNGAALIVAERDTGAANQLIVSDSREAYALLCASFFGNPSKKLRLIGITGTNGKTTCAFLIKSILDSCGHKTGLIGTVRNCIGDESREASLTTPDPFELHGLFHEMAAADCDYCVMEVSSQALAQRRAAGLEFELAAFTNLTQDHLDYHKSFENYAEAKHELFRHCAKAVLNRDDAYYRLMLEDTDCDAVTVTALGAEGADYAAGDIRYRPDGVSFVITNGGRETRIEIGIPGEFTVYNAMTAFACAHETGVTKKECAKALSRTTGVPGRIELVPTDTDYTVIIDYAHSPDGLKNVLSSLRKTCTGRIITVFGCGGDRDRTKRPIMGKIAADMSDFVIITSDNPRSEDPGAIVEEVAAGARGADIPVVKIVDRTEAIGFALNEADEGDTVLLAGKGHETYQILSTGKIHYDEREIVKQLLSE